MGPSTPSYFLFPHTTLPEEEIKRLALLFPALSLFQIVRPLAVPEWAAEVLSGWPALRSQSEIDQVSLYLRSCRDFAALHGEGGLMACMTRDWSGESDETRLRIQSELKGRQLASLDRQTSLVLEAAAFLEMARDLDEKEMDIDSGLAEAGDLEGEFRKILGIEDENELAEAADAFSPPLAPDKSGLRFMLPKRIALWLRLFSINTTPDFPVLVALAGDVADEIVERAGAARVVRRIPLAAFPDPASLSSADFQSVLANLTRAGVVDSLRNDLASLLTNPGDASLPGKIAEYATAVCRHISPSSAPQEFRISLLYIDNCTVRDVWQLMDEAGSPAWEKSPRKPAQPFLLLCLD